MPERSKHKRSPEHPVDVGGQTINSCDRTDAAALCLAGNILDESERRHHDRNLIESLATVLEKYGLIRAAVTLRQRYLQ